MVGADIALHSDGCGIGQVRTAATGSSRVILDITAGHFHLGVRQIGTCAIGRGIAFDITAGHDGLVRIRRSILDIQATAIADSAVVLDGTIGNGHLWRNAPDTAAINSSFVILHVTTCDGDRAAIAHQDTTAVASGFIVGDRTAVDRTGTKTLERNTTAAGGLVGMIFAADVTTIQREAGTGITVYAAAPALGLTVDDRTAVHGQAAISTDIHTAAVGAAGCRSRNHVVLDGTAVDDDGVLGAINILIGGILLFVVQPDTGTLDMSLVVGDGTAGLSLILDVLGRIVSDVPILIQILVLRIHLPGTAHDDGSAAVDGDAAAAALGLDLLVGIHHSGIGLIFGIAADGTTGDGTKRALTGQVDAAAVAVITGVLVDVTVGDQQFGVGTGLHVDAAAVTVGGSDAICSIHLPACGIAVNGTAVDDDLLDVALDLRNVGRRFAVGSILSQEVQAAAIVIGSVVVQGCAVQLELDIVLYPAFLTGFHSIIKGTGGVCHDGDTTAVTAAVNGVAVGVIHHGRLNSLIVVNISGRGQGNLGLLAVLQGTVGVVVDLLGNTAALTGFVFKDLGAIHQDLCLAVDRAAVTEGSVALEGTTVDFQRGNNIRRPIKALTHIVGIPVHAAAVGVALILIEGAVPDHSTAGSITDASESAAGVVSGIGIVTQRSVSRGEDLDTAAGLEVSTLLHGAVLHQQIVHDGIGDVERIARVSGLALIHIHVQDIDLLTAKVTEDTDRATVVPGVAVLKLYCVILGGVFDGDSATDGAADTDGAAATGTVELLDLRCGGVGVVVPGQQVAFLVLFRTQTACSVILKGIIGDAHITGNLELELIMRIFGVDLHADGTAEVGGEVPREGIGVDIKACIGTVSEGQRAANTACGIPTKGTSCHTHRAGRNRTGGSITGNTHMESATQSACSIAKETGTAQGDVSHRRAFDRHTTATGTAALTISEGVELAFRIRLAAGNRNISDGTLNRDRTAGTDRSAAGEAAVLNRQISAVVHHHTDGTATVFGCFAVRKGAAIDCDVCCQMQRIITITDIDGAAMGAGGTVRESSVFDSEPVVYIIVLGFRIDAELNRTASVGRCTVLKLTSIDVQRVDVAVAHNRTAMATGTRVPTKGTIV